MVKSTKNYKLLNGNNNLSIVWLLFHVRHALFQARANELSGYGVTPVQATVLFVVHSIGKNATPAEISRWLFLKPHSVSGLLSRMEKDGLVRKVKDLDRRNQIRIVPTEKANRLYHKAVSSRSFRRIISCLSLEEAEQLRSYLERLRDRALKELGTKLAISLEKRVLSLVWLLFHVRHALFQARAIELSEYGVTPMQSTVLFVVHSIGDRATPAEISRWLFLKPHSVSGLLARMERDGLVRKVKDLNRKNQIRIVPTEKANQLYRKAVSSRSFRRIISCLSLEEAEQLRSYLERLRDRALKELGTKWAPPFQSKIG